MANSPSMSPPSLLASSSTSSHLPALASPRTPPPQILTPPSQNHNARQAHHERGRRYPNNLGKSGEAARVPLHRRGTSQTYERLEDLLREAGYKETRVVTPQRHANGQSRDGDGGSGAGGVMRRFLSGLVGGGGGAQDDGSPRVPDQNKAEAWSFSLPASPAPRARALPSVASERPPPSPLHSDGSSERSFVPRSGRGRVRTQQQQQQHQQYQQHHVYHYHHHRLQQQYAQLHQAQIREDYAGESTNGADGAPKPIYLHLPPERALRSKPSLPTYAEASPARAYLRQVASVPHIARAPSSTSTRPTPSSRRSRQRVEEEPPPLPLGWFEILGRALLGVQRAQKDAEGEEDGGRDGATFSASTSGESTVRPSGSRASAATTMMRGRTDPLPSRGRSRGPPPGIILTGAAPSLADVVPVRVVCRSAPASRAGSRVRRDLSAAELGSVRGKGKGKGKRDKAGKRRSGRLAAAGPSLTGRVEDDGWGVSGSESSTDEEPELNLRRLLISPKRQMSIQSLRRHLASPPPPDDAGEWPKYVEDGGSQRRRRGLPHEWGPDD